MTLVQKLHTLTKAPIIFAMETAQNRDQVLKLNYLNLRVLSRQKKLMSILKQL